MQLRAGKDTPPAWNDLLGGAPSLKNYYYSLKPHANITFEGEAPRKAGAKESEAATLSPSARKGECDPKSERASPLPSPPVSVSLTLTHTHKMLQLALTPFSPAFDTGSCCRPRNCCCRCWGKSSPSSSWSFPFGREATLEATWLTRESGRRRQEAASPPSPAAAAAAQLLCCGWRARRCLLLLLLVVVLVLRLPPFLPRPTLSCNAMRLSSPAAPLSPGTTKVRLHLADPPGSHRSHFIDQLRELVGLAARASPPAAAAAAEPILLPPTSGLNHRPKGGGEERERPRN